MDGKTITEETAHYFYLDVIKNNEHSDHLLESSIMNIGLLKDDRKYDPTKKEEKYFKKMVETSRRNSDEEINFC